MERVDNCLYIAFALNASSGCVYTKSDETHTVFIEHYKVILKFVQKALDWRFPKLVALKIVNCSISLNIHHQYVISVDMDSFETEHEL